ncbi:UNVERIFIED_CONTAM: TetR/AcrR family transcriptional regulator, partial [Bacillus amyloliquefaciens DSM 7 = ATCC 23350]
MRRSSEQTKAVILAAARDRFARSGFARATIRAIAADAGIDPSMVMRYFGNKNQLFAAAADFDLQIPDLSGVDPGEAGTGLVAHFMN